MTSKPQTVVHFCFKKIWTQFLMTKIQAFGKEIPSIWQLNRAPCFNRGSKPSRL